MKSLLTILFSIVLSLSYSQQEINYMYEHEYDSLKAIGALTGNEAVLSAGMVNPEDLQGVYVQEFFQTKAQGCSGYFPPPGPGLPVTGTDDGWAQGSPYTLPFNFCFFGDTRTQVWFNNNGNISFNGGISAFSSSAFPSSGPEMIAAFWADFDLGAPGGTIHGTITPTAAIINWVNVGYFNAQGDKRNTCQIIITDGNDPLIVGGNVAINYGDMQWTTGSASGGVNGFGGTPATAGANKGDGVNYFTIGRFDHPGTDYDGPLGANDGVSFLDDKSFYFDFCTVSGGNIPPVPLQTSYCDTFQVCGVGDTMDITFPYLSPELNQLTTVTFSSPTLQNVTVVNSTVANTGELTLRIIGDLETPGVHDLIITGTDNAAVPGVTEVTYTVKINDPDSVFTVIPLINYTSSCPPVALSVSEPGYDGYLWSPGNATTAINTINTGFDGVVTVVLEKDGCKLTIDSAIYIPNPPQFNLEGSFAYCSDELHTTLSIPDTLALSSADWKLNGTSVGTDYTENLSAGTYTLSIVDSSGVCTSDTTFTVVSILSPVIFTDTIACNFAFQVQGTVSPSGGLWSAADTAVHFSNASILNPLITATEAGIYQITYTDSLCGTRTANLEFIDYAFVTTVDTVVCFGVTITTSSGTYPQNDTYVWNEGTVGPTITAGPGVYTVTASNECNSHTSTMTIAGKVCFINAPNIIVLSSTSGNNKFYLTYDGVDEFHMTIVNRWGNLIAEFDDPAAAWDGKDKGGNIIEEGTYFYNFTAKMATGEEVKKQGFVQVFH